MSVFVVLRFFFTFSLHIGELIILVKFADHLVRSRTKQL